MEKSDISIYAKSDRYYLEEIGAFIKNSRIAQHLTQKDIASAAGINRTTLVQLEKGHPVNLMSLIQVLRALKQLHVLNALETRIQVSPLKMAAAEQKQVQRVRRTKSTDKPKSDW